MKKGWLRKAKRYERKVAEGRQRQARSEYKEVGMNKCYDSGEKWLSNQQYAAIQIAENKESCRQLFILLVENGLFWAIPLIGRAIQPSHYR